ncbi:hypothetical protein UFOVP344_45 [uncultured Caudovirales phage]|uniref:Uncharacterized protein n=1 Tax=uncultured Caudovirales phage TaxID=2100421 RepID=A0A6J5LZS3_9CAUD|nr:hypothetical protein UFOVP344_45 [uncultured Caudovirales phage]
MSKIALGDAPAAGKQIATIGDNKRLHNVGSYATFTMRLHPHRTCYGVNEMPTTATQGPVFVILADGEIDQMVETQAIANREKRDLEKMGCTVKIKKFEDWQQAEAFETKKRGW